MTQKIRIQAQHRYFIMSHLFYTESVANIGIYMLTALLSTVKLLSA